MNEMEGFSIKSESFTNDDAGSDTEVDYPVEQVWLVKQEDVQMALKDECDALGENIKCETDVLWHAGSNESTPPPQVYGNNKVDYPVEQVWIVKQEDVQMALKDECDALGENIKCEKDVLWHAGSNESTPPPQVYGNNKMVLKYECDALGENIKCEKDVLWHAGSNESTPPSQVYGNNKWYDGFAVEYNASTKLEETKANISPEGDVNDTVTECVLVRSSDHLEPRGTTLVESQLKLQKNSLYGSDPQNLQPHSGKKFLVIKHKFGKEDIISCFDCKVCGKLFVHETKLSVHYRTHTGERPFRCNTCSKSFAVKNSLIQHISIVHSKESFKCKICYRNFRRKVNFVQHNKIGIHFKCAICKKPFANRQSYVAHKKIHSQDDYPFKCKI